MFQNQDIYNDDTIQVTHISLAGNPLISIVSIMGEAKLLDASDNFFSPNDIVKAYVSLLPDWEDCKDKKVEALKEWLIGTQGCTPEELE